MYPEQKEGEGDLERRKKNKKKVRVAPYASRGYRSSAKNRRKKGET